MSRSSRDVEKYPRKAIWVYDVIGSYFVDQFYNHLYVLAKKAAEIGNAPNITDGYRSNVLRYHHGICTNAVYYKQSVAGLHEYYQKWSKQGITTMADFEDQILTQFIPDEFYESFTDSDRNTALREIIVCIATVLCESVVSREILPKIIDNHSDNTNVIQLQKVVVSALCSKRDDYFVKFAKQVTRSVSGNNSVDIDTFNALKAEFISEKRARCIAEASAQKFQQISAASVSKLNEKIAEIQSLTLTVETLRKQRDELSAELSAVKLAREKESLVWNQLKPQQNDWGRGRQREKTPYPRDNAVITEIIDAEAAPQPAESGAYPPPEPEKTPNPAVDILGNLDIAEKNQPLQIGWGLNDELW